MGAVGFYIFYAVNWVITLLPLRVLYLVADILFLGLYYFPSYRRKVVESNLRNAFPEKPEKELKDIGRKFYRHLADLFVETLKMTHMSEKQMAKRCTMTNSELLVRLKDEKRDVIAVIGHYNNWEWISCPPANVDFKWLSIYKPLRNRYFDRFLTGLRSKYGATPVPMSLILREILNNRKSGTNTCSGFISDQTPVKHDIRKWVTFLNQDTPVYVGVEKIASKYDMAVVYYNMQKIRRGYYNVNVELLFDHTDGVPEHLITEKHVRRLEEIIREKPEFWLWTHRRWKHKKPVENA